MSDSLIIINSYTPKHEFSCIWMYGLDVMNVMNVDDCAIKRGSNPQKTSIYVVKLSMVYIFFCS